MLDLKDYSYEIKVSKSEHRIPIINNVHIHSEYNPIKEAQKFVSENLKTLKEKKEILILGLGYGYHINQILNVLRENHRNKYKIIVIEPNERTYFDFLKFNPIIDDSLTILSGMQIEEIYKNKKIVDFLSRSPGVLAHPSSFNLYKDYFKSFLSYEAPIAISEVVKTVSDEKLSDYLQSFSANNDIEESLIEISSQTKLYNDLDFFLMAYKEIILESGNDNG